MVFHLLQDAYQGLFVTVEVGNPVNSPMGIGDPCMIKGGVSWTARKWVDQGNDG